MSFSQRIRAAALLFSLVGSISVAQTAHSQEIDHKPGFGFSIANIALGQGVKGPLFKRFKAAWTAANTGDDTSFDSFVAPDAVMTLISDAGSKQSPFTVETIRAATKSCVGPYPFDEGPSWVQLSWICSIAKDAPLSSMLTFRDSPELSLTVWFKNDLIERLVAMEPPLIPGSRLVSMDAYAAMQR